MAGRGVARRRRLAGDGRALHAVKAMLQRGFILLPEGEHGNVISFTPPLTISRAQLRRGPGAGGVAGDETFRDANCWPSGTCKLTKSLGQNFLHDGNQLRRIVAAAELRRADKVLEIGPGLGPLTELLVAKAGEVLAIEKDAPAGRVFARAVRRPPR